MVFKCKMCGGDITQIEGKNIGKCEYCKSTMTLPNLDNERIVNLYNRANNYRLENNFDKAYEIYENILELDGNQLEARWGLLLCKYGVEYVDEPKDNIKVPTCHRTITSSILKDVEYKTIEKEAYGEALELYKNEAKKINEIQKRILDISSNEIPYDIFICYKETDKEGERTYDSVIAEDIYEKLTEKGYKVFFARITLEDKLGSEYEPYIYSALLTAKVMLVVGTSEENFNAVWVKNEWARYLEMMKKDKTKSIIPVYSKIDAYKMPEEFAMLQAQSMDKIGAMQDLIRGIQKIMQTPNSEDIDDELLNKLKEKIETMENRIGEQYEVPIIKVTVSNLSSNCILLGNIIILLLPVASIWYTYINKMYSESIIYHEGLSLLIQYACRACYCTFSSFTINRHTYKISKFLSGISILGEIISYFIFTNMNKTTIYYDTIISSLIVEYLLFIYIPKWKVNVKNKILVNKDEKEKIELKNNKILKKYNEKEESTKNKWIGWAIKAFIGMLCIITIICSLIWNK